MTTWSPPPATTEEKILLLANVCLANAHAAQNAHVALTQLEIAATLKAFARIPSTEAIEAAKQAAREIERGQTDPSCMFDGLPPGAYGLACPCPKCSPQCEAT